MGAKLSLLSNDLVVYLKQTEESTVNLLFPIFKFGNLCFPGKSFISSRFHNFCMDLSKICFYYDL